MLTIHPNRCDISTAIAKGHISNIEIYWPFEHLALMCNDEYNVTDIIRNNVDVKAIAFIVFDENFIRYINKLINFMIRRQLV